jgi:putative CocE/NonD family hydrolase
VSPTPARYASALWALLGLFVLRVVAQLAIALGFGSFLPPWEEWFSGTLAYPPLLASQIAIILALGKIATDLTRGRGFWAIPRRRLGSALLAFGTLYAGVMVVRYAIRMSLYPPERWWGGSIPIFFHWVLASFLLVLGAYHVRETPAVASKVRSVRAVLLKVAALASVILALCAWVGYLLAPSVLAWVLDTRRPEYAVRIDRGVTMKTSDGVALVSDIYRPMRAGATPTILVRIPLSKTFTNRLFATIVGRYWAERGYTVVIQGTRGRLGSGGRYTPLIDERRDGLETLGWLNRQPWFDGRLGMWGGSVFGYTQWVLADAMPTPPSGRSALIMQICSTDFHGMFYPGGAFSLASGLFWAVRSRGSEGETPNPEALARGFNGLPLIEADDRAVGQIGFFDDWVSHSEHDSYWRAIDDADRAARLQAPALLMAGWFDPFLPGQLADFSRIRRVARSDVAEATRLIVGPWAHAQTVVLPGGVTNRNYRLESLAPSIPWFDRQLRSLGSGVQPDAPIRLYVMGANVWRDEQEWPLARANPTAWYLRSGGKANTAAGDGRLSLEAPTEVEQPDVFASDPEHPVPTRGGATLGPGSGPVLQNDVEARNDVLVYSTSPLTDALEVTGPISAVFYTATSTPQADFTAKLVGVHPDGAAYNVSDGIVRARYRAASNPADAGPVQIEIALWPTSMVFQQGHRIRLEIAGTNFPRFDRNLNTDTPIASATATAVSTQAVHHGPDTPSRILLPIVPRHP